MITIKSKSCPEPFKTETNTRDFQIFVDEPAEKGGLDTAMTPAELLGASLASCTSITMRMYMNHKQWEHGEINVEVAFEMDTNGITFNRIIVANGNFDEKQEKRLLAVANACPIHKILEKGHTVLTDITFVQS